MASGGGLWAKKPVGEVRGRMSPEIGAQAPGRPDWMGPGAAKPATTEMPLSLPVQMKEDNGDNNRSEQHPDWPKQP